MKLLTTEEKEWAVYLSHEAKRRNSNVLEGSRRIDITGYRNGSGRFRHCVVFDELGGERNEIRKDNRI